ncbi:MAG: protein kinase [Candidatus Wallbacteria bacterium]|nr:protein kinase [Candidatus Wallbacteria bacterium]
MTGPSQAIESVARHVGDRREEAKRAIASGDSERACAVLRETIEELLRHRSAYVDFHRGVGSVLGGMTGLLLAFLIPGGHTLSAAAAFFGWGMFGERMGRYAGEKLSEADYLKTLVELHRSLVETARNSRPTAPPIHFWKSLVVLETPFAIFAPVLEGQGLGASWTGVKSLLGFDPFALALENARPEFPSWETLRDMARALVPAEPLPPEAEPVARTLYRTLRTDSHVNLLLGRVCHAWRKKGVDVLVFQHKEQYSEDLLELFNRDYDAWPEDPEAVQNLSGLLARRSSLDPRSGLVYLAHSTIDPSNLAALANAVRALPDLAPHQGLLARALERWKELNLGEADRLRILESRALDLAEKAEAGPAAVDLYRRLLALKHVGAVAYRLARVLLAAGDLSSLTRPVAATAFERRAELEPGERALLRRFFEAEASMNPTDAASHLSAARLMLEAGDWRQAAALLEGFQLRAREPAERMESLALLARAFRSGGQFARAFEYYKGLCLVKPSRELVDEVHGLHEQLREARERPALAREMLLLIKTVEPAYVSAAGAAIDDLLADYASVFDHYAPDSLVKVGGGGMAEVFRGVHKKTGETHIIKKLRTDFGTTDEMERFAQLFTGEIRAIKRINRSDHAGARHVITLHHESAEESHYCYSMEALDEVLAERLARLGPLPEADAASLLAQIAGGLAAAHAAGVVHRDLNPRNIGFRGDTAKIFDFGTAHILRTTLHITRTPRSPDYILGTPCYMSPEQSTGDPFDERTDLFSLGCVGYELLTGELAFPGQVGSLVLLHDAGFAGRLRTRLASHASKPLVAALMKALGPRPQDRWASAGAFLKAIAK